MNASRRRALLSLDGAPLTEFDLVMQRIQRRTLVALCMLGLAKFRAFGKPPSWVLTPDGREWVDRWQQRAEARR